ncbi:MAG: DUF937 domain-containing protein [Pseudomonadota bacterium]
MSILETILKANNGDLVRQVAGSLDLKPQDAGAAIAKMLPALTGGIKQNASSGGGLDSLLGALTKGNHARYVDNPAEVVNGAGIADGNAILGHILGSKDRSRQVAAEASQSTGIDVGILKKMLPMIATMAMGSMSKQQSQGGALSDLVNQGGAGRGLLDSFLDKDNDGSMVDDLLGMAKRFL